MIKKKPTSGEIVVQLPQEFEDMQLDDLNAVMEEIDNELKELQVKRWELLKQRKMTETVKFVMYPDEAIKSGYQDVAKVVLARLRRAKELIDGEGKTKREDYRGIAEKMLVTPETPRPLSMERYPKNKWAFRIVHAAAVSDPTR